MEMPFYLVEYDPVSGEILAFHNPVTGKPDTEHVIELDVSTKEEVGARPHRYRIIDGKLHETSVHDVEPVPVRPDVASQIVAGLVVNDVCYSLEPSALAVLQLDLASNAKQVRAIAYVPGGFKLVELSKEDAKKVATAIGDHLVSLHCG
jgi:hypothetical protein